MEDVGGPELLAVQKVYEGKVDQVLGMGAAGLPPAEIAANLEMKAFEVVDILANPENEAKLRLARQCTMQAVESSLARAGVKAVAALEDQLTNNEDPAAILASSKILLDHHAKNVNVPATGEGPAVPAVAVQVILNTAEAKKIVRNELRQHHDR